MATQIKLRRDTYQNWFDNNPVLGLAEPGYDTTNKKLKIGDGVTTWRLLPYFDDKETDLSAVVQNIIPDVDNTYDLGSPAKRWKDAFIANNSLYIGDIKLSNNNGQLLVQQVTDAGLVSEAPIPNTPGVVTTDRVVNGSRNITLNSSGDFIPSTDILQDLGSPTNRFRHVYVGPGSVYIGSNVITESATGSLVLPGLTRATGYYAEEVDNEDDWGSNPTITGTVTVIDAQRYEVLAGRPASANYAPATYIAQKDGNKVDEITVDETGGGWTKTEAEYARNNNMYATNVAGAINNFNAGDWQQIPFRVEIKAEDTEYEDIFGDGTTLPSQSGQEGKFLTTNGNELSWATVTGGDADLGDFTINSDILEAGQMTIRTNDGELNIESDTHVYVKVAGGAKQWSFANDGVLTLPEGGDIVNSTGSSVLGGGGGGAVVDRSVNFPNGEAGDTAGILANDDGVLYFCTADYVNFNQYINTPFSLETSEIYSVSQSGGTINSATILRNANAFVLFILQNGGLNASDWSITMTDGDFGGEQTCTDVGFNVDNNIYFHWPHREEDPNGIPEGSTFTVTYTGTLARPAIWERISDNGSNRIEYYDEVLDYTSSVELTGNFRVDVDDAHLEVDGDGYWSLGSNNYDTKIFSTDNTTPDPADIIVRANDNDWIFKSNGGLRFPDGSVQTTAYTGQSGNVSVTYVAVNNDGTVYGSTDGENWTSYASPMTDIGEVAVGPTNIVYTANNSNPGVSGYSLWYATAYNSTPTEVQPPENVEEHYNEVKYFSSIEKYVAVGYVAEGVNFPVLLHSSDGVTWTRSYISEGFIAELGFTGNAEFLDIAENDLGFFIISDSSTLGSFFLENITDALDGTTNVSQTDSYEHVVWVETAAQGFRGWHVFDNDEDWWFNANQDPRVGSFELFAVDDLDTVFENAIGYSPSPGEFAVGEYNGQSTIVIGTGDGQIMYWPAVEAGPFVSIPKPYTATITAWTSAAESVITITGQAAENSNEKFTVTGSSVTAYNGTYYINTDNNKVYTNRAMTVPFDTTGLAAFTGTATITWSHGKYIDALHYSNGIFYVGNDDEEFFISTNGGATWTETASFNDNIDGPEGGYLNDIDSYGTVVADTTTVVSQDIAPIAGNGSLWFNSLEGRLYIKYSDAWIDAAPLVQPPPDTDIDVNSITFSDATVLTSATALTPNKLVNGDNELVLGTDGTLTFPRGNLSVGSIQDQETIMGSTNAIISMLAQGELGAVSLGWIEGGIDNVVGSNIAAVTVNSPAGSTTGTVQVVTGNSGLGPGTNIWEFSPDGKLTLPGAVVNSTQAKTGGTVPAPIALDLTKSVNKLTDGVYTLADGVEGQIMYLIKQTGTTYNAVTVIVANGRVDGVLYTSIDHYPFSYNTSSIDIDTLIFTDGAWQAQGGEWD